MQLTTPLLAILGLCTTPSLAAVNTRSSSKKPKDAILLSDVETLTLRGHGAKTTHRRVSAIPQLSCLSHPSLCRLAYDSLDVMRCTNQGSSYDDADVEWSCSAILPEELRLGSTDVICEGYSSSDDPYVLKGSCGVEYRLALTDKGERRYPDLANDVNSQINKHRWAALAFWVVFIGVLGWIIYGAWTNREGSTANGQGRRRVPRQGNGGWPGNGGDDYGPGGGGGGWDPRYGGFPSDDQDEPPPPYPGKSTRSAGSSSQQQGSWRPGFWSGLAAGGAAGYAAGNYGNRNTNNTNTGLWGSGRRNGEPSSSGSRSGSRPGPSGGTHEGTGFGSTRRR